MRNHYTLFLLGFAFLVVASDQQKSNNKLIDACKQATFGTHRKSELDPHIQKQLEKLKEKKPQEYAKLARYAQEQTQKQHTQKDETKKS